jgi:hypothetical protein
MLPHLSLSEIRPSVRDGHDKLHASLSAVDQPDESLRDIGKELALLEAQERARAENDYTNRCRTSAELKQCVSESEAMLADAQGTLAILYKTSLLRGGDTVHCPRLDWFTTLIQREIDSFENTRARIEGMIDELNGVIEHAELQQQEAFSMIETVSSNCVDL